MIARTISRQAIAPPSAQSQQTHAEWRLAKNAADQALQRWKREPTDENAGALRNANEQLREAASVQSATWETRPTGAREAPVGSSDPIEQILRLAELRDRGIVTAEEFAEKKRELLERLS